MYRKETIIRRKIAWLWSTLIISECQLAKKNIRIKSVQKIEAISRMSSRANRISRTFRSLLGIISVMLKFMVELFSDPSNRESYADMNKSARSELVQGCGRQRVDGVSASLAFLSDQQTCSLSSNVNRHKYNQHSKSTFISHCVFTIFPHERYLRHTDDDNAFPLSVGIDRHSSFRVILAEPRETYAYRFMNALYPSIVVRHLMKRWK